MSVPISGYSIGQQVIDILGLQDQSVQRITLDIPANDAVTLTIRRFIGKVKTMELVEIVEQYQLVDKNGESDGP